MSIPRDEDRPDGVWHALVLCVLATTGLAFLALGLGLTLARLVVDGWTVLAAVGLFCWWLASRLMRSVPAS